MVKTSVYRMSEWKLRITRLKCSSTHSDIPVSGRFSSSVSGILHAWITGMHSCSSPDDCFLLLLLDTCSCVIISTVPRLGGNPAGTSSCEELGQGSSSRAAFCFRWAGTLSLGANPCQRLWPSVLSLLMCWRLSGWLQLGKGTIPLSPAMSLRPPQRDCLSLEEFKLNDRPVCSCCQVGWVRKGPPISHLSYL